MKTIYVWNLISPLGEEDNIYVTTYKELIPHVICFHGFIKSNECSYQKEKIRIGKKADKVIKTLIKLAKENEPIDSELTDSILKEISPTSSFKKVSVTKINVENRYRPSCFKNVKIDYDVKDYVAQFELACTTINCYNKEHSYKFRITDNPSLELKYKLSFQNEEQPKLIKTIALKTGFEDRKRFIQSYPISKLDNPENYKIDFLSYIGKIQNSLEVLERFIYCTAWENNEVNEKKINIKLEFDGFDKKDINGDGLNSFRDFQNFGTKLIRSNNIKVFLIYNKMKIEL